MRERIVPEGFETSIISDVYTPVRLKASFPRLLRILLALMMVLSSPPALAADNEIGFVRLLATSPGFMAVLRHRAPLEMVAEDGAVGKNRKRYLHAAVQRDVIWLVLRGLAEQNQTAIDASVRALEYGFKRQSTKGNFDNGEGETAQNAVGADAFFLQSYCRIQLLVGASHYADQFASRFSAMDAMLPKALEWLKANQNELHRQDRNATNRLFFDSVAFSLCGMIAGDKEAIEVGNRFARFGLENQRSDGTFNEHGGHDSSYQAVSLLNIAGLLKYLPAGNLREQLTVSFAKGAEWQLGKMISTGEIIAAGNMRTGVGREGNKRINYYEVALALLYAGYILKDDRFTNAAESVSGYIIQTLRG